MRKIFGVVIFAAVLLAGCDYGYGNGGDLPPGHHDSANQYEWHVSYDDGTAVKEYYTDTQPAFDQSKASLDLANARESKGSKLTNIIYDTFAVPVDEYSIVRVVKQPIRSDSADRDDFEWRLVFTDAAGDQSEFYLHHLPQELWPSNSAVRVVEMVRGYWSSGKSATGWSFSEYYLAGPANFFLVEERPQNGWN